MNNREDSYAESLISAKTIDEFDKKGWVKVNLGIDKGILDHVLHDLEGIREKAIVTSYPARRIYFDYIHDLNIASVELPYNDAICTDSIRTFFNDLRLGSLVCRLMGWNSTVNTLARLFTMGQYKYRGQWHRDYEATILPENNSSLLKNRLQVGIFFEAQEGFRIFKKSYDRLGNHSVFDPADNTHQLEKNISHLNLPIKVSPRMYDVIHAEPGSVIFFDPYLYHQGSSQKRRLDFHLRFDVSVPSTEKTTKNNFQDFDVVHCLHRSYDPFECEQEGIPQTQRPPFKTRAINTVNYIFPFYNAYNYLRNSGDIAKLPTNFCADMWANTVFQR